MTHSRVPFLITINRHGLIQPRSWPSITNWITNHKISQTGHQQSNRLTMNASSAKRYPHPSDLNLIRNLFLIYSPVSVIDGPIKTNLRISNLATSWRRIMNCIGLQSRLLETTIQSSANVPLEVANVNFAEVNRSIRFVCFGLFMPKWFESIQVVEAKTNQTIKRFPLIWLHFTISGGFSTLTPATIYDS